MEEFLKEVIKSFEVDFAFHQALYKTKTQRDDVQSRLALQAARDCGADAIKDRLRRDRRFRVAVLHVGEHRLVLYRSKLKETATPLAPLSYGLDLDQASHELVKELLENSLFAYAGNLKNGTLDRSTPFDRSIITEVIVDNFFLGEDSVAAENSDRFVSSLASAPDEKEIPAAMLSISCTAIFSCLQDWKMRTQGIGSDKLPSRAKGKRGAKKPEFPASELFDEYDQIAVGIIDAMKARPKMYHRIMHKVYMNVMAMCGQDDDARHGAGQGARSVLVLDDE